MTPHISSKKEDIAKTVLCPGDPLRAKYIAENFLENSRLVNSVRNILAYTGTYKGKEITVFASGMGMPSMGIYCYELYKFYDVETIIRIGSCGAYDDSLNLMDTVLVKKSYTEGNFAYNFSNKKCFSAESSSELDELIIKKAKELKLNIKYGKTFCAECFDPYLETDEYRKRMPDDILAVEMEAFALFYLAKYFNRKASCLLTISDNIINKKAITAEERSKALTDMITLALEVVK